MWRMSSSYKLSKVQDGAGEWKVDGSAVRCARLAGGGCTGEGDLLTIADDVRVFDSSESQKWPGQGFGPDNTSGPPAPGGPPLGQFPRLSQPCPQPRRQTLLPHGTVP